MNIRSEVGRKHHRSRKTSDKMKAIYALVLLTCSASAQFGNGRNPFGFPPRRIQSNAVVDAALNGWEYNFSWLHTNNANWQHNGAVNYCKSLPGNWDPISISDNEENEFVQNVLGNGNIQYIWTSGTGIPGNPGSWKWANGPFVPFGWSQTGGFQRPQPDNREGTEACLAVLNNIYPNDGITWHDVACHHEKPTICERPARQF